MKFDISNLQKSAYKLQICLKLYKNIEPFIRKNKYVYIFDTDNKYFYEAYPENKDTKVLNMYNIFNLQKRHCE